MRFKRKTNETSLDKLNQLIQLYTNLRTLEYEIYAQYDLLLEDPGLDRCYMNIEPLLKYKRYIEEDMNGSEKRESVTTVIRDFNAMAEQYKIESANYADK